MKIKGADQPAHMRRLVYAFVFRLRACLISRELYDIFLSDQGIKFFSKTSFKEIPDRSLGILRITAENNKKTLMHSSRTRGNLEYSMRQGYKFITITKDGVLV